MLTVFGRVRAGIAFALIAGFAVPSFTTIADAAGALAIGKCGAYGQAFDYPTITAATAAARQQCAGDCTIVTMKRSCAALAIDLKNPCGAHGYAVRSRISNSLNEAARKCYEFGGTDCVIRAWACDAKG